VQFLPLPLFEQFRAGLTMGIGGAPATFSLPDRLPSRSLRSFDISSKLHAEALEGFSYTDRSTLKPPIALWCGTLRFHTDQKVRPQILRSRQPVHSGHGFYRPKACLSACHGNCIATSSLVFLSRDRGRDSGPVSQ
jgi:hypothetical protein